jgi:GMP synthase (glutamine-hydrolysing)
MTGRRLLAIQHEEEAPPAWLGEWWAERGLTVDVVRADLGRPVPERVEHDGLVVLGGYMGATDDTEHGWLAPTRDLLARAVEDGVPTLGVCLGYQMLAVALGGTIGRNPAGPAVGLRPITLADAGRLDPLLAGSDQCRAIHYNQDVVTSTPDGATVLATGPDGSIQALRFAERAWGVQFHPETTPAIFALWLANTTGSIADTDVSVATAVAAAEAELRWSWQPLADRFAAVVAGSSPRRRRASPPTAIRSRMGS